MTEDQARSWLRDTFSAAAMGKLERFVTVLLTESAAQSLISRPSFAFVWSRHVADSAQLVPLAPLEGAWVDIGSGGGLPGIVVAILRDAPLIMVEPRRKRAEFLVQACESLGLTNASVVQANVQRVTTAAPANVISARAVANLSELFAWTQPVVSRETLYLLPRGENAVSDLALAERAWHGVFHVEQSLTDPAAGIVVAQGVRSR